MSTTTDNNNDSTAATVYSTDQEGSDNISRHAFKSSDMIATRRTFSTLVEGDMSKTYPVRKSVQELTSPQEEYELQQIKERGERQQQNAAADLYALMSKMRWHQGQVNHALIRVNECARKIESITKGEGEGTDMRYKEAFIQSVRNDYLESIGNPTRSNTMSYIQEDFKPAQTMIDEINNMLFNVVYEPNETTRLSMLRQKQEESEKLAEIKRKEEEITNRNRVDLERRLNAFNRYVGYNDDEV